MIKRRRFMAGSIGLLLVLVGVVAYWSRPAPDLGPYEYGRAGRARLPKLTLLNHEPIMRELLGEPKLPVKSIGVLVYDGVDAMEAIGPLVVFSELMGVKVEYVGRRAGIVTTDLCQIVVERSIDDVDRLDLLVAPGGVRQGLAAALDDQKLLDWLRKIDSQTVLTAGVGKGTLLLAEAGLLKDRRVAFGWPAGESNVRSLGAHFDGGRHVQDGKYWSCVGGTASIDMALAMLEAITGRNHLQAAMLDLEYAPQPPYDGGSPESTPPELLTALQGETYRRGELTLFDARARLESDSPATSGRLQAGVLVYDGCFTLDVLGPLAVLSQLRNADVRLIRFGFDERIKSGRTRFVAPVSTEEVGKLDLLVIPGGSDGTWELTQSPAALDWIRRIDAESRYTTSVCTGSWVLGAAGLLKDRRATTNWYRARQMLERFGAKFEPQRYVTDGKYWTSAGVSAGLDMSFALLARIDGEPAAREALLRLHYRPEPPIDAGAPEATDDLVLDMMHQMYDYVMAPLIGGPP